MIFSGLEHMGEAPFNTVLYPRPGARRAGPQDVQIARQRHRSAGDHRPVRRGRAALHACHRQLARKRYALLRREGRGQPQLCQQDLERVALYPDEPRRQRQACRAAGEAGRSRTSGFSPSTTRWCARSPTTSTSTSLALAVSKLYDFIWDDFCDWYIEIVKTRLQDKDDGDGENAQKVLCYVLSRHHAAAAPVYAVHHRDHLAGAAA